MKSFCSSTTYTRSTPSAVHAFLHAPSRHSMPLPHVVIVAPNVPSALHETTELPWHVIAIDGSQFGKPLLPMNPASTSSPEPLSICEPQAARNANTTRCLTP